MKNVKPTWQLSWKEENHFFLMFTIHQKLGWVCRVGVLACSIDLFIQLINLETQTLENIKGKNWLAQ